MDNKVKHRIVGVVVIAVFLVILIPALIKNVIWKSETVSPFASSDIPSGQSNGTNTQPQVEAFQTSQIAHVSLDNPMIEAEPIASVNNSSQMNAPTTQNMPISTDAVSQTPVASEPVVSAPQEMPVAQPVQAVVPEPVMTVAAPVSAKKVAPVVTASPVTQPAPAPKAIPAVVVKPKPAPVVPKLAQKPVAAPKAKVVVVKKTTAVPVQNLSKPHAPAPVRSAVPNNQKRVRTCLQMGAFSNAANAQSLVNSLKGKGFSSAMKEATTLSNGKTAQRVVMCQMMTRNEALAMRSRVAKATGTTPIIVK